MSKISRDERDLAAAQRGLIIQRVLVEGQSLAQAGAPFGVDERQVACWIAAYQRHGMASLREEVAVEPRRRRRIGSWFGWVGVWLRGGRDSARARRVLPRRGDGEGGAPNGPPRRSRWN